MLEDKNGHFFERSSAVGPAPRDHRKRGTVEKHAHFAFSVINLYLWFHGIGFTERVAFDEDAFKSSVSMFFVVISEGNFIYSSYIGYKYVADHGMGESKKQLAELFVITVNTVLRIYFYVYRRKIIRCVQKLSRVYAKVSEDNASLKKVMVYLVILLVLSDAASVGDMLYNIHLAREDLEKKDFAFGLIQAPHAIPFYYISKSISSHSLIHAAVTAYFCAVCYLLKKTLLAFKGRISQNSDKESMLHRYNDIADMINDTNDLLHPFLLTVFTSLLTTVFQQAYEAIFFLEGMDSLFKVFIAVATFTHFVLMCTSSSSVINAAGELRSIAQTLSIEISESKRLQFFLQTNEGFPGFKILNSIIIDSSMVLTAIGVLLTYGILIATFSINSQ